MDKISRFSTLLGVIRGMGTMELNQDPMPFASGASAVIGKLMVRLRGEGLLSPEAVDAVLHTALATVVPPRRTVGGLAELFGDPGQVDREGLLAAA